MRAVIYLEEEDVEKYKSLKMGDLIKLLPMLLTAENTTIIGRNKGGHFKKLEENK